MEETTSTDNFLSANKASTPPPRIPRTPPTKAYKSVKKTNAVVPDESVRGSIYSMADSAMSHSSPSANVPQWSISIGAANLLITCLLVLVTTCLVFAIVLWQYMEAVDMVRKNTEDIINQNNDQNIQLRDMAVSQSKLALEMTGDALLRQAEALVIAWILSSVFGAVEHQNNRTIYWTINMNHSLSTTSGIQQIIQFITISMLDETITTSTAVFNNDILGWYMPSNVSYLYNISGKAMTKCNLNSRYELTSCCSGGSCQVDTYSNYQDTPRKFFTLLYSLPAVWSPLYLINGVLHGQYAMPINRFGRLDGIIIREVNMGQISAELKDKAKSAFPGMVIYTVDQDGLLTASTQGDITTTTNGAAVRLKATQSPDNVVKNSAIFILAQYSTYTNASSFTQVAAFKVNIKPDPYRATVDILNHTNLQWAVISLVPENQLLEAVSEVETAMASKLEKVQSLARDSLTNAKNSVNTKLTQTEITLSLLVAALLCVAAVVATMVNRAISKPLKLLAERLEAASMLKLSDSEGKASLPVSRFREIRQLLVAYSKVNSAMTSFQLYVPPQVVLQIVSKEKEARLHLKRAQVTVLFMDVEGFTSLSETLSPSDLQGVVGEFMEGMSEVLAEHGTIDKYIGDCIMAFWNAPAEVPNHPMVATLSVLKCGDRLLELHKEWAKVGWPLIKFRAGLNTGEVLVGNVGSSQRLNFTVLGDSVNVASRLEGLNKQFSTHILCSGSVLSKLDLDKILVRFLGKILLVGKHHHLEVYEVMCEKQSPQAKELISIANIYKSAFQLGVERKYIEALEKLSQLGTHEDGACKELKKRISSAQSGGPEVECLVQAAK